MSRQEKSSEQITLKGKFEAPFRGVILIRPKKKGRICPGVLTRSPLRGKE